MTTQSCTSFLSFLFIIPFYHSFFWAFCFCLVVVLCFVVFVVLFFLAFWPFGLLFFFGFSFGFLVFLFLGVLFLLYRVGGWAPLFFLCLILFLFFFFSICCSSCFLSLSFLCLCLLFAFTEPFIKSESIVSSCWVVHLLLIVGRNEHPKTTITVHLRPQGVFWDRSYWSAGWACVFL